MSGWVVSGWVVRGWVGRGWVGRGWVGRGGVVIGWVVRGCIVRVWVIIGCVCYKKMRYERDVLVILWMLSVCGLPLPRNLDQSLPLPPSLLPLPWAPKRG